MTRRHIPRRRPAMGLPIRRELYPPRQVLVPLTRRPVPLHPLSMAAVELRRRKVDVAKVPVVKNAKRRMDKAAARRNRKARR